MSGSTARLQALASINSAEKAEPLNFAEKPVDQIYGENVFHLKRMKNRLPKGVFKSLQATIQNGETLDPAIADQVAGAMKDWAIENGATHYTHVFYPLTGLTAEKHDSFVNPGDNGEAVLEFSGEQLVQGEPDASSFPSGGIRATFEARGYTAWDVTSPAYIYENPNGKTLCIPTAFVSWTGEALDKKTPLLRSMQALDKAARRLLRLFGHDKPARVAATAGPEQEYFLVDRNFYFARPDLMGAGRTLFGAAPPKGQEFDDHYFGHIPERVLAFMMDCERELYKLGIPVKTRHNEVAPGQYEVAPVFENANVATDHQQMVMTTLKRVAEKYGMVALLHEKPFAGLNGSGKHLNFSMGNATQGNLLAPGDDPAENAQFLAFCAAVVRAVFLNGKLLRATVASAGNDHRLGANEAPPAIISIFLGEQLTKVFEAIKAGGKSGDYAGSRMELGVDTLPKLPKDPGDRNRTSPFAFIGNRFEFRAVGSQMSLSNSLVVLNTAVADSLDHIAVSLESKLGDDVRDDEKRNGALQEILRGIMTEAWPIIFNGDNYSEAWHAEAESRGLPNLKTTPDALPIWKDPQTFALFEKHNVLTRRELESRFEVFTEQYNMVVNVEKQLTLEMAKTIILPAAMRHLGEVAATVAAVKQAGGNEPKGFGAINDAAWNLESAIEVLEGVGHGPEDPLEEARHNRDTVLPAMQEVRAAADKLEAIVADDLWPLPSYQEMLFVK